MLRAELELTHPLVADSIDEHVARRGRRGVFVLGSECNGEFEIKYIGRSDTCLNERLHDCLDLEYGRFAFVYCATSKDAFHMECAFYHALGGEGKLDNATHPKRPLLSAFFCPVPDCSEPD